MKLIIITTRYNSSITKSKVQPTILDENGKPLYLIGVSDERAKELIDAGVAEEYMPIELTDNSNISTDLNSLVPDDSNNDDNKEQLETPEENKAKNNSNKKASK